MKREEIDDAVGKLIDQRLNGFMWDTDDLGEITALQLSFEKAILIIQPSGNTFKIQLSME